MKPHPKKLLLGLAGTLALRQFLLVLRAQSLRGKTAAVFGGSRGFGLDIARALLEKGCKVAICARDADELERAKIDLARTGGTVLTRVCDASDEAQVRDFVEAVSRELSPIDVLVTNAATIGVGPIEHMDAHDFEDALRQTFWTAYFPTMAVLPHMRARKAGSIVHVTSFGGKVAVPHLVPYSTAKFAATGFSEGLRAEVAKDGISVTTVMPSLMRTGSHVNVPFKGQFEREYTWFTAGLLFGSRSARGAAERVVRAIEQKEAEPTMSPLVRLAGIAKEIAPGVVATLLALQNRLLPKPVGSNTASKRGRDVVATSTSKTVRTLDAMTRRMSEVHNEL